MRRGIPYGPEATDEELDRKVTTTERGLLFTCYHSDLTEGFEFITSDWFNNSDSPPKTSVQPGANPIMTDKVKNTTNKDEKLFMSIVDSNQQPKKLEFDPFVESHGGAYFFMPSLDLLLEMAH